MKLTMLKRLAKDESGATAIEYGLIAALVSVAAIVALTQMGQSLNTMFTTVRGALDTAVAAAGGGGGGGGGG
jgi:pilus assembly protein Flp/PilA